MADHHSHSTARDTRINYGNSNTDKSSSAVADTQLSAAKPMITTPNSAASSTTDYRTTIHFLTSPSSTATVINSGSAMDCDDEGSPGPSSVPVSTLLSPGEDSNRDYGATAYYSSSASATPPRREPVSLPPIHTATDNVKYRDDELTGMAGLMELASPPKQAYHSMDATRYPANFNPNSQPRFGVNTDTYSSTTSSNSTSSHTAVPPALSISATNSTSGGTFAAHTYPHVPAQHAYHPQSQPLQQHQQYHYQQQQQQARYPIQGSSSVGSVGSPQSVGGATLTPDSLPPATPHKATRSFPATVDDVQIARRRSQSTDSTHNNPYNQASALPYVLGNANIRNRSFTSAQRQRTSDTPLFPILLHRIINDPQNESWIRWCEDGKAFKFSSAENLLSCLQAAGLRAQNYHSIEKNLNDYRFTRLTDQRRKIPDPDGKLWWMFSHPQFLRDFPDGIVNIQRRRRTNPAPVSSPQPSAIPSHPQPQSHPQMPHRHSSYHMPQQQQQQQHLQPQSHHYPAPNSSSAKARQGPDSWM
ncbi:Heat shock transcription factor [Coemansia spiralis]|uniref:Heat shock transcription factor n=2 Tax=Coemansia TaxID=4863 RepID=A0A9W8GBH9_9FUNG|nr:hypothetical protein BX070DRAFT_233968 [Coemansia spiralis]KAJ2621083.1 Heat shock transcription factor [Coemansia sp. RSA 1358]KAJ2680203.1 Heat shock transcription factor [Coemansia spiralis]